MLNTVLKSIGSGSPRVLPNWDRYVMTLKLRTEIMKTRFLKAEFMYHTGTSMITQILQTAITPDVLACKSDYKRYVEHIDPSVVTYRAYFDPTYVSQQQKNHFINSISVPEFFMNVSMETPMKSLPLDKPWQFWEPLVPVRIIYHDAKELITELYRYRMDFKGKNPTHIIYSIDLVMLMFKYIKYIENAESLGLTHSVEDFVQEHVVVHWFDDLRRIWLFNILDSISRGNFNADEFIADEVIAPRSMLKTITTDIFRLMDDARKSKSLSIGDICATKWFGDHSLKYWLDELNTDLKLPSLRQYKAQEFINTLPYAMFIINMMTTIGRQDVNLLFRNLLFELHQYKNQNIVSNIQQLELRSVINQKLDETLKRVRDSISL